MPKRNWITLAAAAAFGLGMIAAPAARGQGVSTPKRGEPSGVRRSVAAAEAGGGAAATPGGAQAAVAMAGEWPKWLGPDGTGISRDPVGAQWPAGGPRQVWKAKVGEGFSSAVAAAGRIYFFAQDGKDEALTCLDANTGAVVWRQAEPGGYPKNDYPGARASPTIDGDKIYTYGGGGRLVCRNLASGQPAWSADVLKLTGSQLLTWGQASSPLVYEDKVVVQSGEGGAIAIAFDKASGRPVWQSQAKGIGGYAAVLPVDVGGKPQLIVFAGAGLFGLDPAGGKTLWQQPWKAEYNVVASTPVYDGKGNLFVTTGYGSGKGAMFQLTPTGAKKLWEKRDFRVKFPATILDGDTLYMVTDEGRGPVKAMEWPTGKIRWELKDAKMGFGGSIVRVGDDKIIAQAQTGEIHLIQVSPTAGKILGTFKAFDGSDKVWSMPIVYKGKLYAKGPDELVCFDLK